MTIFALKWNSYRIWFLSFKQEHKAIFWGGEILLMIDTGYSSFSVVNLKYQYDTEHWLRQLLLPDSLFCWYIVLHTHGYRLFSSIQHIWHNWRFGKLMYVSFLASAPIHQPPIPAAYCWWGQETLSLYVNTNISMYFTGCVWICW